MSRHAKFSIQQMAFENVLLLVAYRSAIFLKEALPFGESILTSGLTDHRIVYFLLPVTWLLGSTIFRRLIRMKQVLAKISISFLPSLFSAVSIYFLLSIAGLSVSRIVIAYFIVIDFVLLLALPHLAKSVASSSFYQKLVARPQGSRLTILLLLGRINEYTHQVYGELFLSVGLGIVWALHISRMGLFFTSDSVEYLRSTMNFGYLQQWNQSPLWPPLYPFFVALLVPFKPFPADAAALLSGLCMIAFLVLFALVLRRVSGNFVVNAGLILVLVSMQEFNFVFQAAFSEQLFIVWLALSCYWLLVYTKNRQYSTFFLAALAAGLAAATRYAGIGLGFTVLTYAFYFVDSKMSLLGKLQKNASAILAAFTPLAIVLVVNLRHYHTLTGRNDLLFIPVSVFTQMVLTLFFDLGFPMLLVIALFVLRPSSSARRSGNPKAEAGMHQFFSCLMFGYVIFIFLFSTFSPVSLGSRILAPAYVYLFAYLAYLVNVWLKTGHRPKQSKFLQTLASVLFSIFVLVSLARQYLDARYTLVDIPLQVAKSPTEQRHTGFDLSPTASGFSNYFHTIFLNRDEILVAVTLEDQDFPRSFLHKGSLFQGPEFTDFTFANISFDTYDYDLVLFGETSTKRIHFLDVYLSPQPDPFGEELMEKMDQFSSLPLHLVVSDAWFDLNGLTPEILVWPTGVILRSQTHIEPYWIFEIWQA